MDVKRLRIVLRKTDVSDLICIGCGRFKTEWVVVLNDGSASQFVGMHTKCVDSVHQKRGT